MRRNTASAHDLAPLVLELARALRARRAHPPEHPVVAEALARTAAAWRAAGSAELVARAGRLEHGDGRPLEGAGAAEVASELCARGAERLLLRGEPTPAELSLLLETLVREPAALAAAGGAAAALRAGGAHGVELLGPTPKSDAPAAAEPSDANSFLGQHIAELVKLLAELERCDDIAGYNLIANKVEVSVDVLVRAKRVLDGYRAAIVYARHATTPGVRGDALRREAGERLRRLATSETLLDAVVEQACVATGLASVQANQVLIAIGTPAVGALLRHCAAARDASRERAAQTLIAMGDAALVAVVDDLRSGVPERARRAARLLGEMQNPRGVEFLADALRADDVALAREAARALARIPTDSAVAALVAGLRLAPAVAETCAGCLGGVRQTQAARALGELLDLERDVPDGLRREAIRSLGRLASAEALNRLKRVLDHAPFLGRARFRALRVAAAQAIGQIGGPVAIQALAPHARRGDAEVRQACAEAVRRIERAMAEK
ncbi:MAG TPA: HEAT repeat domain-containing protein [Myxococcota bacterium]|nr:HEAT repeat domain-containing protein [Myxococcota bacterium]